MGYTMELLDDQQILLYTTLESYNPERDLLRAIAETREILDSVIEPVYGINDYRKLKLSLDDLIQGAAALTQGDDPLWKHPNLKKLIMIISDTDVVLRLTAEGLGHDVFGNINIEVVTSLEEAFELCHS